MHVTLVLNKLSQVNSQNYPKTSFDFCERIYVTVGLFSLIVIKNWPNNTEAKKVLRLSFNMKNYL